MLAAEATQRAHAVVEQVIADLKQGPLAHVPSGAFNLLRAAGALAATRQGQGQSAVDLSPQRRAAPFEQ